MSDQHQPEAGRTRLASALIEAGDLPAEWLPALSAAPRDLFIPPQAWARADQGRGKHRQIDRDADPAGWWEAVAEDSPITTQFSDGEAAEPSGLPSSSNSQPRMVFGMLAALQLEDGDRVLEIGTGTGWNAALLAARLGHDQVVTVEYDETVAAAAAQALKAAGSRVTTVVGDGTVGYAAGGPYDRVIATCSVTTVPPAWIEQTRPGGLVLAPLGPDYGGEGIVRLTVREDGSATGLFVMSSAFMRLRQQRPQARPPIEYLGGKKWPGDGDRSTTGVPVDELLPWIAQFAVGLQVPTVAMEVERYSGGKFTLWLTDTAGDSWATADHVPGEPVSHVVEYGPRRLWDEVAAAWAWWDGHERPDFDRFGLTVSPDGVHRYWLDIPEYPLPVTG
ncbi:methyltransferase domain-containing protein [Actinacidiphila sp. bgisy160]|uniref:methyltransferase domain-containing protein n=1 Tax=Actinacidiphila sp. bgisy160 TaxID=3413796 RepID=UPI003D715A10